MPAAYEGAIRDFIDRFADLPGIGPKGAQRIAFYLLSVSQEDAQGLAESITAMRQKVINNIFLFIFLTP